MLEKIYAIYTLRKSKFLMGKFQSSLMQNFLTYLLQEHLAENTGGRCGILICPTGLTIVQGLARVAKTLNADGR